MNLVSEPIIEAAGFRRSAPRKQDSRGDEYGYWELHEITIGSLPRIEVRKYTPDDKLRFLMFFTTEDDFKTWAKESA